MLATGEYILPLDSDNKIHKNYLTKAIDILEKDSSIDVVYGKSLFFGDNDGIREAGLNHVGSFDFARILDCNYIDACAVYRKTIWEKVGGYDGLMPAMGHEDWEMWIHIFLSGGKFYFIEELCFYYRIVAGSMLVTDAEKKHQLNKEYIYNKHSMKIISNLLEDKSKFEMMVKYLDNYKLRSIAKLLLGYKI